MLCYGRSIEEIRSKIRRGESDPILVEAKKIAENKLCIRECTTGNLCAAYYILNSLRKNNPASKNDCTINAFLDSLFLEAVIYQHPEAIDLILNVGPPSHKIAYEVADIDKFQVFELSLSISKGKFNRSGFIDCLSQFTTRKEFERYFIEQLLEHPEKIAQYLQLPKSRIDLHYDCNSYEYTLVTDSPELSKIITAQNFSLPGVFKVKRKDEYDSLDFRFTPSKKYPTAPKFNRLVVKPFGADYFYFPWETDNHPFNPTAYVIFCASIGLYRHLIEEVKIEGIYLPPDGGRPSILHRCLKSIW